MRAKNYTFLPLTDSQKTRLVVSYDMAFLLFGLHFDLIRSKLSSKKHNFQLSKEQLFGSGRTTKCVQQYYMVHICDSEKFFFQSKVVYNVDTSLKKEFGFLQFLH